LILSDDLGKFEEHNRMGGSGSGRWGWHDKKTTVEECLILSATKFAQEGAIASSPGSGCLWWTNTATGEQTASLGYSREIDNDVVVLRLRYTVTRRNSDRYDVEERIDLRTTPSAVGGVRWWFACPLVVDGRICARRIGKLYLPPSARYFGCRHCYGLTYTTCQDSHRFDRLFRNLAHETGIDARLVKQMFERR